MQSVVKVRIDCGKVADRGQVRFVPTRIRLAAAFAAPINGNSGSEVRITGPAVGARGKKKKTTPANGAAFTVRIFIISRGGFGEHSTGLWSPTTV